MLGVVYADIGNRARVGRKGVVVVCALLCGTWVFVFPWACVCVSVRFCVFVRLYVGVSVDSSVRCYEWLSSPGCVLVLARSHRPLVKD